jgi:transcriptional regulator with XRE-family HTH domain
VVRWARRVDGRLVSKKRPDLRPLGGAVKRLRVERGLSQEALDDIAGLHANHIGGIERGERNVTLATLFKLAEALEVPPDELLTGYREARLWSGD